MFEKDNKSEFLSVPVALSFTKDEVNFMKSPSTSGLTLQQIDAYWAAFSKIMNFLVADSRSWRPDSSKFLWSEIKSILNNIICAQSILTLAEENELKEAEDFLTDIVISNGNEIRVPSVASKLYMFYEDEWFNKKMVYANELSNFQSLGNNLDENLRQQWLEREKQLQQDISKAENNWITLGNKDKFEHQQQRYVLLAQKRSPIRYVDEYIKDMSNYVPELPMAGGGEYYPTIFLPLNAFDIDSGWQSLTILKEEIRPLMDFVPELKEFFSESELQKCFLLVAEYKVINIVRPWMRGEFFDTRYWKLPDNRIVCDGNIPGIGSIPAYITGMIVIRRISVNRRVPDCEPLTKEVEAASSEVSDLRKRLLEVQRKIQLAFVTESQLKALQKEADDFSEKLRVSQDKHAAAEKVFEECKTMVTHVLTTSPGIHRHTVNVPSSFIDTARATDGTADLSSAALELLFPQPKKDQLTKNLDRIRSMYEDGIPETQPTSESNFVLSSSTLLTPHDFSDEGSIPHATVVDVYELNGFSIPAFICRRNPKCPNPDENLF